MRIPFKFGIFVLSLFVLAACASNNSGTPSAGDSPKPATDSAATKPDNSNYVVSINDSSTISVGPMKMDFTLNLKATNTTGKITGTYTGSATTKAVSHAENIAVKGGVGSINAPVEGKSTSLTFDISPYIPDNEKLAPLAPAEPDDGKLAPLVPSDDDKLAPLTKPEDQPQYEGEGTMVLDSSGTATGTINGYSGSRGIGNTSSNGLKFLINGSNVQLEVRIPQIGGVLFNGTIQKEAK